MKALGTFVVTVALIVGLVSCVYPPPFPEQYNLTISSTEGGSVSTPGEGTFTYWDMDWVELVGEADEGYQFVEWTGDVRTIVDVNAANTTITMSDDYSITANFALGIALEIWDWYDLDAVRDNLAGHHILMNDLNSTTPGYAELAGPTANGGKGWFPIGVFSEGGDVRFTGTLDGQGHKICDLFINRHFPGAPYDAIGLVGVLGRGGVVENIGVVNLTVTGDAFVGGLVGANYGTVSNSYSAGNVTGSAYVGGLAGSDEVHATVTNSYSAANVAGSEYVGGLVGGVGSDVNAGGGTVSNSYSTGNVTGNSSVGGLAGQNRGTVGNSYSTGSVTGMSHVGGLVAINYGTVGYSFWDIETSGRATSAGGMGRTTAEMKSVDTFAGWNIMTVANPTTRNPSYIWNIVEGQTYPFLIWQSVS